MHCKRCNGSNFERDEKSGNSFCSGCGTFLEYDNYESSLGGIRGPVGTYVRVGTIGTGSVLAYKDKKIYEAENLIRSITLGLNLGDHDEAEKIKRMVSDITDGEFGQGEWLPVLIGACCYVLVRKQGKGVLSMEEVGAAVGCELHQLGSMVKRVVEYLGLELREFNLVGLFEKTVSNSRWLSGVESKKKERVTKQGVFLMNCSLKWFLSTGRRPMPLVVAVLGFVCEVNGVKVKLGELAEDAKVSLVTCKSRYKELLEKLVKVAHEVRLPWADDVTVKNIVKHSNTLLGLMEAKSMRKRIEGTGKELVWSEGVDIVRDCLSKKAMYCYGDDGQDSFSRDSDVGGGEKQLSVCNKDDDNVSTKQLSTNYKEFVAKVRSGTLAKTSQGNDNSMSRRRSTYDKDWSDDLWKGTSRLSQKLLLKEVLEKDVGLDALPPSYIKGCVAVERRREKIKAAKLRIQAIQQPKDVVSGNELSLELEQSKKKRKRDSEVNWEDLIIQSLVLHDVKDEEIEKGHYKALLGLHVFNSVE